MQAPDWWRRKTVLSTALMPAGLLVSAVGRWRRWATTPYRAPIPVICVGNLTVGGTGKTPTVLALAERLKQRGLAVHLMTRGYRGRLAGPIQVDPVIHDAGAVGDEALLLAAAAPTWVARDRAAGARAAVAAGAQAIIMDDGLQNPGLAKDLSLIVVDAGYGFGNGRVIPAGPLREPIASGVARATAIIVIGAEGADLPGYGLPVLQASLHPRDPPERWAGRRVLAFAGIGRPEKFFESLRLAGADRAETRAFPDHHAFTPDDGAALLAQATALGAELVTTAKDHVRLPANVMNEVAVFRVTLQWRAPADAAAIDRLLDNVLGP